MGDKAKIFGYKITNNKTGLYLSGINHWTKAGRVWVRKSAAIRAAKETGKLISVGKEAILEWDIICLSESSRQSLLFDLDKLID